VLGKLASEYRVNLNWLLTGIGNPQEGEETALVELVNQEAAAGRGVVIADYAETKAVPVPHALIHPYSPATLKAVFISGDSMAGEKIYDGDIVIFYPLLTRGDAVYVVSVGDTILVKRIDFDKVKKAVTLISANPSYPPRVIAGKDLESVKIEGRVIACLHRM
jgi:phage repressor protein C with HTH and peptisase S24 domain